MMRAHARMLLVRVFLLSVEQLAYVEQKASSHYQRLQHPSGVLHLSKFNLHMSALSAFKSFQSSSQPGT
jgi:hypothetical protein